MVALLRKMIVKHYIAGRMLLVQENTHLFVDVTTEPTPIAVKRRLGELKIFQLENVEVMEGGVGIKSSAQSFIKLGYFEFT